MASDSQAGSQTCTTNEMSLSHQLGMENINQTVQRMTQSDAQGRLNNNFSVFGIMMTKESRPVEIDQFLSRVDEDAILPKKLVFRDKNFDMVNKWYKAIKFLKDPPSDSGSNRISPKSGLIRLKDKDFHRFN